MRTTCLNFIILGVLVFSVGCGKDSATFSVLPDSDVFFQNTQSINSKVDILWVIDNSGSMQTSQNNLSANFPTFIDDFSSRNLDFHIGVIGSDAFVALPQMSNYYNGAQYLQERPQAQWAKFRDGGSTHSGIYVLNALTPNLNSTFVVNATLGINGLGDERPLQSFKVALSSSLNSGFLRLGSYLAVILLTDEDDFSHDGNTYLENQYANPALHTIQSYVSFLDGLTGSTATQKNYAVHSIAIQDAACRDSLGAGRKIGQRVNALATATGGVLASLCADFATQLEIIAGDIIELSTQFFLSRIPVPETIVVRVNGQVLPSQGWVYNASANSIVFQGSYVPTQGSQINVSFDPVGLGG